MKLFQLPLVLFLIFVVTSCSTSKKSPAGKEAYTPEMQKIINEYPDIIGFEKRAIFLSKLKTEEEKNTKIEIIPGRMLLVDCNKYGISGEMSERKLEKNGYPFYFFNSRGEIFSTKMGCPDDTKEMRYVSGESIMVNYRSDLPLMVYTSQFFEVRYSVWKGGEIKSVKISNNGTLATEEAMTNAIDFPIKEGWEKHVLFLPELDSMEEINRKVEIIPGKNSPVDNCNEHHLNGNFATEQVTGFGYDYYVFESDGNITSTKMKCMNNKLQNRLVTGESNILSYNSRLPVVVYTPKGFDISYRIWETNGKMY